MLIITDNVDENLNLASRNLKNVLVVEPRYADPVSMVHFDKVVLTRAGHRQARGDVGGTRE